VYREGLSKEQVGVVNRNIISVGTGKRKDEELSRRIGYEIFELACVSPPCPHAELSDPE
jgi:hypothetical protein